MSRWPSCAAQPRSRDREWTAWVGSVQESVSRALRSPAVGRPDGV